MAPHAAAWLVDHYVKDGALDLTSRVLVTPGRRAGRRLMELLVLQAQDKGLILLPPRLVTPGRLPDELYDPPANLASPLSCLLARAEAIRRVGTDTLCNWLADPPQPDDWPARFAFAQEIEALHGALAANLLDFAVSGEHLAAELDEFDPSRWQTLAALQLEYERVLEESNRIDQHRARRDAAKKTPSFDGEVVLIGVVELNGITRRLLEPLGERVTALIHAPDCEAEGFDVFGTVHAEYWHNRPIPVNDQHIRVAERPRDQAGEVAAAIDRANRAEPDGLSPDHVTVGVADESLAPLVARTLDLAALPVHSAFTLPLLRSGPVVMLHEFARFARTSRFDALAALLRHPDLEAHVTRSANGRGVRDWLTLLDRYHSDHLQGRLAGRWLGDPKTARRLKAVHDMVRALLPADANEPAPLPRWAGAITKLLESVYADRPIHRHHPDDAPFIHAIEAIGQVLRQFTAIDEHAPWTARLTFAQAVELLLIQLAEQSIPEPVGDRPAVELLGWLELMLDDAPCLVIAGCNEGAMPAAIRVDPLLPDRVRRILNLPTRRSRHARDAMMLTAIVRSRKHLTLIAGRRTAEGDPLLPSRLLLACDDQELPGRLLRFFGESGQLESPEVATPSRWTAAPQTRFIVPPVNESTAAFTRMHVTAFRDYLACPYRFYLKHVLKLEPLDDALTELDAAQFGTTAHKVLERFALSDAAHSTDAAEIARFLSNELDHYITDRFGDHLPPSLRIQTEQLRRRLEAFAAWQENETREGWLIQSKYVEQQLTGRIEIENGDGMDITGRIDRIDLHPENGYRLVDYKTSDRVSKPENTHRRGPKGQPREWIDLQLPLYRILAEKLGIGGEVKLGYIALPKKAQDVAFYDAPWSPDDLRQADECARWVIEQIRVGVFGPPADPPPRYDDFASICQTQCLQRHEALQHGQWAPPGMEPAR